MPSSPRLRWMVIGPFLVVVAMMVVLGIASSEILSAVRAYVGGESQWSKGQKDASFHLAKFATSHAADEFQRYRAAIAVPLGDSLARIELERPHSDLAAVRKGFLAGGNHPDDIASMIWLFRNFRHVSFMAQAIDIWAEADQEIAALDVLAQQIRQRVAGGHVDAAQTAKWLSQLTDFNDRLTLLEQRFSGKLSEASRIVSGLLLGATVLLGLTF